jgi:hypothetical protein
VCHGTHHAQTACFHTRQPPTPYTLVLVGRLTALVCISCETDPKEDRFRLGASWWYEDMAGSVLAVARRAHR